MADATAAFFDGLPGSHPELKRASGTVAVEATKGRARRRWVLEIVKGDVTVSRKAGSADVTLRAPEDVLRAIATGRTSPTAAVLRGSAVVEGNPRLLVLFRRMLPGPPKRGRRR
jgi:putative sterol carrier protein